MGGRAEGADGGGGTSLPIPAATGPDAASHLFDLPTGMIKPPIDVETSREDPEEYILFVDERGNVYRIPQKNVLQNKKKVVYDLSSAELKVVRGASYASQLDDDDTRKLKEVLVPDVLTKLVKICMVNVKIDPPKKGVGRTALARDDYAYKVPLYLIPHLGDDGAVRYYAMPLEVARWFHETRVIGHSEELCAKVEKLKKDESGYVVPPPQMGYMAKLKTFVDRPPTQQAYTHYTFDPAQQDGLFEFVGKEGEFQFASVTADKNAVVGIVPSSEAVRAASEAVAAAVAAAASRDPVPSTVTDPDAPSTNDAGVVGMDAEDTEKDDKKKKPRGGDNKKKKQGVLPPSTPAPPPPSDVPMDVDQGGDGGDGGDGDDDDDSFHTPVAPPKPPAVAPGAPKRAREAASLNVKGAAKKKKTATLFVTETPPGLFATFRESPDTPLSLVEGGETEDGHVLWHLCH
jgi:hypothetical protein